MDDKCIKLHNKKYQSRDSPPYSAMDCKNQIKYGNDGNKYQSSPDKNMIYKWIKIQSKNYKSSKPSKTHKNTKANITVNKIANRKINTNTKTKKENRSNKKYMIHDNGIVPFHVYVNNNKKTLKVYMNSNTLDEPVFDKLVLETKYQKIFDGGPIPHKYIEQSYSFEPGNTILVSLGKNKYIFIGPNIYSFTTGNTSDDEIIEYFSPIVINDIPYPYARTKTNTYLMLFNVFIKNEDLDKTRDKIDHTKVNASYVCDIDPYNIYSNYCGKNNLEQLAKKFSTKQIQNKYLF